MVILNKIYTKRGDDGKTELGNGERVKKFSKRVVAYGTVDELNSLIGIVTSLDIDKDLQKSLLKIQNDLFDIGADLCVPKDEKNNNFSPFRFPNNFVLRLENEIDLMNSSIEPIKSAVVVIAAEQSIASTTSIATLNNKDNEQEYKLYRLEDNRDKVEVKTVSYVMRMQ